MNNKPPYKDRLGRWLTMSLFEGAIANHERVMDPPFSLTEDIPGKINALKTFVAMGDPTGYDWAMKYLGSYQHWEHLMKVSWFKEWYEKATQELHTKMRSAAIKEIQDISQHANSDSQRLAAAKYLAERPYEKADIDKKTAKRGRPSKAEKKGALNEAMRLDKETAAEAARVNLRLVK